MQALCVDPLRHDAVVLGEEKTIRAFEPVVFAPTIALIFHEENQAASGMR